MDNLNTYNNIAVLVDADNAEPNKMQSIIEKIATYGRITTKRIYGNWQKDTLKSWEDVIKTFAFNAVQQFDYVKGKNATDMALVIDAMELLYTKRYDAFVIVSSDSDYTPLNIKLRETGICIVGIGKQSASDAFKRSCDEFIEIETLSSKSIADKQSKAKTAPTDKPKKSTTPQYSADEAELHRFLKYGTEVETWANEEGFVNVASIGQYIKRVKPDFDIKKFGVKKLPDFIEQHSELYETKNYKTGKTIIRAYRLK